MLLPFFDWNIHTLVSQYVLLGLVTKKSDSKQFAYMKAIAWNRYLSPYLSLNIYHASIFYISSSSTYFLFVVLFEVST